MSGKKIFQIDPENQPNRTSRERVVSERGRKELPPGTKGGENLKPDRHYEHKQYAFDSYCKKVLKCEACNGYRQISRRQKHFASLEELFEADLAQLAVYDRYSWEYTTFPVGGAVILIEDDGLAEALLGLSQEDREIFMMHWFLRMTDAQIARYINMPRRTVNTRRHKAYRLLTERRGGHGVPAVWLDTGQNVSVCLMLRRRPPAGLSLSRSYNGTPHGKGNTQRPALDQFRSKSRIEIISFASSRPRRSSSTWGRG